MRNKMKNYASEKCSLIRKKFNLFDLIVLTYLFVNGLHKGRIMILTHKLYIDNFTVCLHQTMTHSPKGDRWTADYLVTSTDICQGARYAIKIVGWTFLSASSICRLKYERCTEQRICMHSLRCMRWRRAETRRRAAGCTAPYFNPWIDTLLFRTINFRVKTLTWHIYLRYSPRNSDSLTSENFYCRR